MRLRSFLGLLALLAAALGAGALSRRPLPARAAEPLCFSQPGVTDCVAAVFRDYWEGAGGLPTFGYPLGPAADEATPDGGFLTQYFERARFEYHPENPQPFQVQLGLLGRQLHGPSVIPPDRPQSGCQYFEATGYNVCPPFLNRWQAPGETLGRGSLDLYGLPISPLLAAQDREGRPISVQWFERARFELHGQNQLLLGLLGRELAERAAQPAPPPAPTAAPAPPEPITPEPAPYPTPVPPPPPTAIPAPIEAPFPQVPCDENVPAPIEGIQAWAVMPVVGPPFDAVICVRLIVNGEPAHPAFVQTFRGTPDGVIASKMHTTSFEGVADFIFYVGTIPSGATIPVEAVATFAGREYRTTITIRRD